MLLAARCKYGTQKSRHKNRHLGTITMFGRVTIALGIGPHSSLNRFRVLTPLLHGTPVLSIGRQPNFAALNTGRHLYSAGRPSRWTSAHILVMDALIYIFALWVLSIFFSSPNLSGRRLDVYHTSTHGVALVQI